MTRIQRALPFVHILCTDGQFGHTALFLIFFTGATARYGATASLLLLLGVTGLFLRLHGDGGEQGNGEGCYVI